MCSILLLNDRKIPFSEKIILKKQGHIENEIPTQVNGYFKAMNKKSIIISLYPLTIDFLREFSRNTGKTPQTLIISNIVTSGYLHLIGQFINMDVDTIYIPLLNKNPKSLLPVFKILTLLPRASRRVIVNPDFTEIDFGFVDCFFDTFTILLNLFFGGIVLASDQFRLIKLCKMPRLNLNRRSIGRVLYMKTNLSMGVKAGGSVTHTSGVIGAMAEKGYHVDFVSADAELEHVHSELVECFQVDTPSSYIMPRELNHYRHNRQFIKSAVSELPMAYDFIYQRMSLGNFSGPIVSRTNRIPLVLEYNGSEVWLSKNWGSLAFEKTALKAEEACLRHAHLVVTVSDVLRDELIERGVEPERVLSVPNGVDLNVFDPNRFKNHEIESIRSHYGIAPDALVFGFVGTFGHWHGAEILAKAVNQLVIDDEQWLKKNKLHFVFIGDGVRWVNVEEILSSGETEGFCTLTGLVSFADMPLFLTAIDVMVAPHISNPDGSPFFGSPTKLFEYMAMGRPTLASDLNQISEVLEGAPRIADLQDCEDGPTDEQCGILVKPGNEGELISAIKFITEHPKWRVESGKNSRKRANSRHTWKLHVEAIIEKLDSLVEIEPKGRRPKIKILINGLHAKTGGGITYLKNMIPIFCNDTDLEIHLCLHEEQKDILDVSDFDLKVYYLDFQTGFWRLPLNEQIHIPQLAKKIGTDITFSPANYGPFLAPKSIILLRNALSVAFVEWRPTKLAYWAMVYLGTTVSVLFCRRAVAVSRYARRSAGGGMMGLLWKRSSVIYHGVGEIFSPLPEGDGREDFLLAVSDIYVQKNLKNLLLAVNMLREIRPDIRLKIAGSAVDGEYYALLVNVVEELGLENNIEFLGAVSPRELAKLYRSCGVFVFPSSVETFGNPLVEAMASGAPIASSNTAAMPEIAQNGALFFDPDNIQEMKSVIERLLVDKKLCRELSNKALIRSKKFLWELTAMQTIDVFKRVANEK